MLTDTDKAYLAGLIDGEGSIGIDKHGGVRSPSVRISLTNTNIKLLEELNFLWGGWLSSRRKRAIGWKPAADLIWAGKPSSVILEATQPFLRIKKEQCKIALDFNRTVNKNQTIGVSAEVKLRREILMEQMTQLNKRGSSH